MIIVLDLATLRNKPVRTASIRLPLVSHKVRGCEIQHGMAYSYQPSKRLAAISGEDFINATALHTITPRLRQVGYGRVPHSYLGHLPACNIVVCPAGAIYNTVRSTEPTKSFLYSRLHAM
jgi:hypothetical protein